MKFVSIIACKSTTLENRVDQSIQRKVSGNKWKSIVKNCNAQKVKKKGKINFNAKKSKEKKSNQVALLNASEFKLWPSRVLITLTMNLVKTCTAPHLIRRCKILQGISIYIPSSRNCSSFDDTSNELKSIFTARSLPYFYAAVDFSGFNATIS